MLAILLSIVLAVGLCPIAKAPQQAWAEEGDLAVGMSVQADGTDFPNVTTGLPAAADGVIKLTQDLNLDGALRFSSGNTTIDLAGHTLTVSGSSIEGRGASYASNTNILVDGGSLTIKDSAKVKGKLAANVRIVGSETDSNDYASKFDLKYGATIEAPGYAVIVGDSRKLAYGVEVVLGGTVKTTSQSSSLWVMGNIGNSADSAMAMANGKEPKITISGNAVIGGDNADDAINMNGACTVETKGKIFGSSSCGEAISVKRGTLKVTGGAVSASGAKYTETTVLGNLNGGEDTGAAISAVSTYNTFGAIDIIISGGTISSAYGDAVLFICAKKQGSEGDLYNFDNARLSISGGTFKPATNSQAIAVHPAPTAETKPKVEVSGGKYPNEVDASYLQVGYVNENTGSGATPYTVAAKNLTIDSTSNPSAKKLVKGFAPYTAALRTNRAELTPEQKQQVVWASSNASVATVDNSGKVSPGGSEGATNITATLPDGNESLVATCTLSVVDPVWEKDGIEQTGSFSLLNGGSVKLLKDVAVGRQTNGILVKEISVDLNGHDLTLSGTSSYPAILLRSACKLTITGKGTVKGVGSLATICAYGGACEIEIGPDVTIDATDTTCNVGVMVDKGAAGSSVVVNGNVTASTFGLYVNGSIADSGASISVGDGANVVSGKYGIYAAGPGNYTVEGSVEGGVTGIELRAGTLTMSKGSVKSTSKANSVIVSPNGSGTTTVGAAIAIAQHTTKKPIHVTISGGKIEGPSALYESDPQGNNDSSNVELSITGGDFTGVGSDSQVVYSADKTAFVSGGTFNNDVGAYGIGGGSYIASGKVSLKVGDVWQVVSSTSRVVSVADGISGGTIAYRVGDSGEVTSSPSAVEPGQTIAVTPEPNSNRAVSSVSYTYIPEGGGTTTSVTLSTAPYTFKMPDSDVVISATFRSTGGSSGPTVTAADWAAAAAVTASIEALGESSSAEDVAAARAAYTALTSTQKGLVTSATLTKLADAEAAVAQANADAAAAVAKVIGEMDATSAESVAAARAAYDGPTDAQKALVPADSLKALTDAEAALAKADVDAAAAAAKVIDDMDATDAVSVAAARAAYNGLTDAQKKLVSAGTVKKLTDAEAALATAVAEKVDALGDEPAEADVVAARAAYDALDAEAKAQVPEAAVAKLTDAEKAIADAKQAAADKAAADAVTVQITSMDATSEASVAAARAAYNALTDDQKALVTADTLKRLADAEAALAAGGSVDPGATTPTDPSTPAVPGETPTGPTTPADSGTGANGGTSTDSGATSGDGTAPSAGGQVDDVPVSAGVTVDATVTGEDTVTVTSSTATGGSTITVNTVEVAGKTFKVTAIAPNAFKGTNAKKVVIGSNVKTIGASAFANARNLTSITIGKSVTKIAKSTFSGDKKLKSVTLGKSVKTIGKNAFKGATKLKSVTVKSSKLTKASVRNIVKNSKVKTIKLKGVSKKARASYKKWAPKGVKVR